MNYQVKEESERNIRNESGGLKRYLFLDIDGVLNTSSYINNLLEKREQDHDEFGVLFDPNTIDNLSFIINYVPDVKIIISSTWRMNGLKWMNQLWKKRKMPGYIYGFTPVLEYVRFQDVVNREYSQSVIPTGTRGLEISEWLRLNTSGNQLEYKFAILDDSDDFPIEYKNHLIMTDYNSGITKEDVVKALEILL